MSSYPPYWGPPTSSIDFCEANYVSSPYIAEFHNTWSNISIVGSGMYGFTSFAAPRAFQNDWPRFYFCWFGFVVVGLGSMAFHCTMRRGWQRTDELPMMLTNLVFVYALETPALSRSFSHSSEKSSSEKKNDFWQYWYY